MAIQSLAPSQHGSSSSKTDKIVLDASADGESPCKEVENGESFEVFQTDVGGVDFWTVSWQRATIMFLKMNFAMSILVIPGALAALGSIGGSLYIIGFTALNICTWRRAQAARHQTRLSD